MPTFWISNHQNCHFSNLKSTNSPFFHKFFVWMPTFWISNHQIDLTITSKFWNSVDLLSSWSPHPIFPDNSICVNIFSFTCPKSNFLNLKLHFLTSNHFKPPKYHQKSPNSPFFHKSFVWMPTFWISNHQICHFSLISLTECQLFKSHFYINLNTTHLD